MQQATLTLPLFARLARLVLIEARRGGLPWLAAGSIAAGVALAAFLSQVALTESRELQVSIVAAWLRACAAFLMAAHVATRTLREHLLERLVVDLAQRAAGDVGRHQEHRAGAQPRGDDRDLSLIHI